MEIDYRILAQRISKIRKEKKLTQAQLAELIDVHEKYIGKIEAGKQNITIKTLNKLANALNIDVCRLLEEKN